MDKVMKSTCGWESEIQVGHGKEEEIVAICGRNLRLQFGGKQTLHAQ